MPSLLSIASRCGDRHRLIPKHVHDKHADLIQHRNKAAKNGIGAPSPPAAPSTNVVGTMSFKLNPVGCGSGAPKEPPSRAPYAPSRSPPRPLDKSRRTQNPTNSPMENKPPTEGPGGLGVISFKAERPPGCLIHERPPFPVAFAEPRTRSTDGLHSQ